MFLCHGLNLIINFGNEKNLQDTKFQRKNTVLVMVINIVHCVLFSKDTTVYHTRRIRQRKDDNVTAFERLLNFDIKKKKGK